MLSSIKSARRKVRLWQAIKETHDSDYGVIEEINTLTRTIRFRIPTNKKITLNPKEPLFFHSPYRDALFKSTIKNIYQGCIEVSFPKVVKVREARSEIRTVLGIKSYHYAKVSFYNKFKEKVDAKLKILDFSTHGLALSVDKIMFENLNIDDKIVLRDISIEDCVTKKIFIVRNKGELTNKIGYSNEFRLGLEAVT